MALLVALCIAVLTGTGVWLLLRPRSFDVVLGLTLLSYAVNVFILGMGRLTVGRAPMVEAVASQASAAMAVADPLPQALVLTAIVISFAMTALLLVLALRSHAAEGDDRLEPEATPQAGAPAAPVPSDGATEPRA